MEIDIQNYKDWYFTKVEENRNGELLMLYSNNVKPPFNPESVLYS